MGAGQAGLIVAARFKQMNIPTLVIDRLPRIGDSWRQRYPTLALHSISRNHASTFPRLPSRVFPRIGSSEISS